jgi:hypothetical protein
VPAGAEPPHFLLATAETTLFGGDDPAAGSFGLCTLRHPVGDVHMHFTVFCAPAELGPVPFLLRRRHSRLLGGSDGAAESTHEWHVLEFESGELNGLFQLLVSDRSDGLEIGRLFTPRREVALLEAARNHFAHLAEYDGASLLLATPEIATGDTADALRAEARAMFDVLTAELPHLAAPYG